MSEIATRNSGFSLQPRNLPEAMQMADMLAKSQMVPKCYQGKPQDTLVAMMMGSELGLNPIQSLQNIAVINGKPSIYGDAMLALVQNHPAFGGIKESFDDKTMTATCTVWRKGGEQHTQEFSKQDADAAGLWGKAGPWKQYPKRMISLRARGFALRNQFADALAGLISREEAEDMPVERDVTPSIQRIERSEPQQLPEYPADKLEENLPKWQAAIESGRSNADGIIAMISTKFTLTEEQQQAIHALEQGEAA